MPSLYSANLFANTDTLGTNKSDWIIGLAGFQGMVLNVEDGQSIQVCLSFYAILIFAINHLHVVQVVKPPTHVIYSSANQPNYSRSLIMECV